MPNVDVDSSHFPEEPLIGDSGDTAVGDNGPPMRVSPSPSAVASTSRRQLGGRATAIGSAVFGVLTVSAIAASVGLAWQSRTGAQLVDVDAAFIAALSSEQADLVPGPDPRLSSTELESENAIQASPLFVTRDQLIQPSETHDFSEVELDAIKGATEEDAGDGAGTLPSSPSTTVAVSPTLVSPSSSSSSPLSPRETVATDRTSTTIRATNTTIDGSGLDNNRGVTDQTTPTTSRRTGTTVAILSWNPTGEYRLVNRASGRCASWGSDVIDLRPCSRSDSNQVFRFEPVGADLRIAGPRSGPVMSVDSGSGQDRATLNVSPWSGAAGQRWSVRPGGRASEATPLSHEIISSGTGHCVTALADGGAWSRLVQDPCFGVSAQLWELVPA